MSFAGEEEPAVFRFVHAVEGVKAEEVGVQGADGRGLPGNRT